MKNPLILIFSLFISISYGQSKLDSLVFEKINQYRSSKSIPVIKWDSDIWKASNHHASYLRKLNGKFILKISHYEKIDLDSIKTLNNPNDRISFYTEFKGGSECVNSTATNRLKNNDINRVAYEILDSWKKSPPHNKGILDKDLKFGAICVNYTIIKNIGVCYECVSVFNACVSDKYIMFNW